MSGRSANSVRELLGKFEESNQRISPPSRGRSPAGSESVTSTDSKPFSKVRTSFVSVERSGQMAPSLRKLSNNFEGNLGGDGQVDLEATTDGGGSEKPMANGNPALPHPTKDSTDPLAKVKEEDAASEPREPNTEPSERHVCSSTATLDSDKPVSTAKDDNATSLQSDRKDEKAVSDGGASVERRTSLGDLLKGHAFEQEADTIPEVRKPEPSEPQDSSNSSKVNGGQPKEPNTTSIRSTTNTKATSSRPPAIVTKKDTTAAPSASTAASTEITAKPPKTPKTPQDVSTSTKQPASKTASPKQSISAKPTTKTATKEHKQVPPQRSSRPSAAIKAPTAAASKAGQASTPKNIHPTKKTGPVSPPTKTHPKSPTRPVRLPASLTAPTAASVAKLGATATARPPSRTSHTITNNPSVPNKDRAPAAASQPRPKPPRASLPAPSAAPSKAKARTSIAGSKPADGSFLARMMRPTQSSASKTHEKVEPKTPPKKTVSTKPHEASEGTVEHRAHEGGEGQSVPSQDALEPLHVPDSHAAQDGTSVDTDATSVAAPEAVGTKGENQGINGYGATPSEAVSA